MGAGALENPFFLESIRYILKGSNHGSLRNCEGPPVEADRKSNRGGFSHLDQALDQRPSIYFSLKNTAP